MLMASRRHRGRRRVIAAALLIMATVAALSGCGKAEFTYVANKQEKTYFKVPSNWHLVDQKPVDDFIGGVNPDSQAAQNAKSMYWSVAYDASDQPTANHMLSGFPTADPVIYSMIYHVPQALQGSVSLDFLRDFVFPVTQSRRSYVEQQGGGLPGFELLDDEVLTPAQGIHGIRVVYNYELGLETMHTFDFTALTNNDSTIVYLLLIRCTARCYRDRAAELDAIATSFTVRSTP
jgi:hypothetical protein